MDDACEVMLRRSACCPDLDDFFLVALRFDSGVRYLDGCVVFGESTVLARLNRGGTWVGLVFQHVERYEVTQEHVIKAVEVQESRGMLDVRSLGCRSAVSGSTCS